MTHVAVCTPHGGTVFPEFYRRLLAMQSQYPQHMFYHMELDLQIVDKARNILVDDVLARAPQVEVIWFIDNDVFVPENAGILIEQALQWDIVSGMYFNRHQPYTPQLYKLCVKEEEFGYYETIIDYPTQGLIRVDAVGCGCLAVRTSVFTRIRDAYVTRRTQATETVEHALRNDSLARREFRWLTRYSSQVSPWFEFMDKKGEDMYFCEQARDLNYSIWANVEVKCEHRGIVDVSEGHFLWLKQSGLLKRVDLQGNPVEESPK